MSENKLMIRVKDVKKQYRLGQIGGGTLRGDLQSWWARKRGKEDPNTLIGTDQRLIGTTFMALNGVSFTVNKGEAVGIIGSNGAGKSTLLKLLTHVTAPTEGDIDLYGRVASMLEVGTGFHPEMTGRENVYLNGAILGMTRAEIDAKMDEIIEFSEVRDFIDTPVKRYSSGMFVKLAFSVAAHLDSEIMIMDEVLAVGDMKFQKKCLTKMRQAAQRDGKTVLYVSHNMATIRDLCDRCIVLDKGKVVFDGEVDEGISIYLATKSKATNYVDYSDFKRDNWFKRDNLRLQTVRLAVSSVESLERTEPVRVEYTFYAQESMENIGLLFEVRDELGNPLAASCLYGLQMKKGENHLTASYDFATLSPGKYSNYFTTVSLGNGGS
ncbi:ABC transporter ATP-binding protein, partial [Gemmiger sp.]|uniref:ABC transporter ATP-binding protein n=1 Tax=Gemmiger sp. TaxID=2049027 RepID=UPI002F95341C